MSNPFNDDVDMASFYKPQNKKKPNLPNSSSDDFNFYEQQIEQILQSTVDSSNRSVVTLEESEQIGIATAEDLVVQGEKLQKVNRQMDDINLTTKQSQRNLNNIKSIFGGLKNYFSKPDPPDKIADVKDDKKSASKLSNAVGKLTDQAAVDFSLAGKSGASSIPESSRATLAGTRWEVMNNQVDENLDLMSANLRRLRDLGSALGSEIDDQNSLLDKIGVKAEKADVVIRHQDKQMKKILGSGKAKPKTDEETAAPSIVGNKLKK